MRLLVCSFFVLFILGGCSLLAPKTPEELVAERAHKRIDALMAGDFEGSYQFTTPGYRTTESVGRYGTRWSGVGMWISAAVKNVECVGADRVDRCKVVVEVVYRAVGFDPLTTILTEDWLLIDGDWYVYQKLGE